MRTGIKLVSGLLVASLLVAATTPWRIRSRIVIEAISAQVRAETGLDVVLSGPLQVKLLPRPRVQLSDVSMHGRYGAVSLDAPVLRADIDIGSLLLGRWHVTSATLVEPTVSLDPDILVSTSGTPPRGNEHALPGHAQAFQLQVRSGLVRVRSLNRFIDTIATGIDAAMTWNARAGAFELSGQATWRGYRTSFSAALGGRWDGPDTRDVPAELQIDSPVFSVSAGGVVSGEGGGRFAGRVAASTASLSALLRMFGTVPAAFGVRRMQFNADAIVKARDLSLANATVRLDAAHLEGALDLRRDDNHTLLEGTLATDALDVDALLGDAMARRHADDLYRSAFDARALGFDLDLRVSATAARLGSLAISDAAGAALLRDGRLELTLEGGRAYDGLLKARAIAKFGPDGIDAHADLAVTHVDLGQLSEALAGNGRIGGKLTGEGVLDGKGMSFRDVVAALGGQGQLTVEDGRLSGLSIVQSLRGLGRRSSASGRPAFQPTRFDRASWGFTVDHGVLTIPDGKLTTPGVAMSFGARTALPDGSIDIHAVAAPTDAGGVPVRGSPKFPFDLRGNWSAPLSLVGSTTVGGFAPFLRPFLEPRVSPRD